MVTNEDRVKAGDRVRYVGSVEAYRGQECTVVSDVCCRECGRRYMAVPHMRAPQIRLEADDGQIIRHVRRRSVEAVED
jgi:hypothetical protein